MDSDAKVDPGASHWSRRLRAASASPGGSADADGDNKRWARRKSVSVAGYLFGGNLRAAIACRVMDSSSSGARISIGKNEHDVTVDEVPERFRLVMTQVREQTEVDCLVVRRHGDCLGVKFTSQFTTVTKPLRRLANGKGQR